tara:strand:- start:1038 stop:1910 length:873 start_codon:yes stop_codon:yes gene_type:complete
MDLIEKDSSSQNFEPKKKVLYVVGTPIGNLGDLSQRATSILINVTSIACEDTRHSGKLLKNIGSKAKIYSFYKQNTKKRIPTLLSLLADGETLALISDAGIPGISDPGEELISAAIKEGFKVICIPGPCAAITALASSGLPTNKFCFEGFIAPKGKERRRNLINISAEKRTTIIYESPHKIIQLLEELSELCGPGRPITLARELTKIYEEQIGPNIQEALKYFKKEKPRGEFTIVLGGNPHSDKIITDESVLVKDMNELIKKGRSSIEAAKEISKISGQSKRFLYSLLHK